MYKYVTILLAPFALIMLALVAIATHAAPAYGAKNRAHASVRIEVGQHLGSGVYIGHGLVVTAGHAVPDKGIVDAVQSVTGARVPAVVLWYDADADVGLLKLDAPLAGLEAADLACSSPDAVVGDTLEAIGNPMGLEHIHTWGHVAGDVAIRMGQVNFIADITIAPGNSGGAVFDANGKVAGITVASLLASVSHMDQLVPLAFVIPRSVICSGLKAHASVI